MSVIFDALRGHMQTQTEFAGISIEPYIARIEDGAPQSRGVSISVSDEGPYGERRFRAGQSRLKQANVSVAVNSKEYAETESMVRWFTDLDANWSRPRVWRAPAVGSASAFDIAVLTFIISGVAREETAERYFRATINFAVTYRE